ncbi:MAG TPA: energy-coupling factor transporter transmembrane component T [Acidimicrobiales bacterium]|nr:energy-coupling factor transporter transmembrane component T [Acidimicrobiales bacterium]
MTRPAAVCLWVLAGLSVSMAGADPVTQLLMLGVAWVLLVRARTADRHLRPLAIGLACLTAATVGVNGVLAHTGSTTLITLPSWVPLVGGSITAEGFAQGAAIAVGLVAAISVAAALSIVLEPADLVDALPRRLERTGAALGAALNLVPATAASVVAVRDAQYLRGWRPRGPRTVVDLAVPVLLSAIERSTQLAESMEARAFASGARTSSVGTGRNARYGVVAGVSVLGVASLVAAHLAGAAGSWAAYPTPIEPSFAPAALAPPVLLGLAALLVPADAG